MAKTITFKQIAGGGFKYKVDSGRYIAPIAGIGDGVEWDNANQVVVSVGGKIIPIDVTIDTIIVGSSTNNPNSLTGDAAQDLIYSVINPFTNIVFS